jgi:hypothetical protein
MAGTSQRQYTHARQTDVCQAPRCSAKQQREFRPAQRTTATYTGDSTCFQKAENRRLTNAINEPSSVQPPARKPSVFPSRTLYGGNKNSPIFGAEKKSPRFHAKITSPCFEKPRELLPMHFQFCHFCSSPVTVSHSSSAAISNRTNKTGAHQIRGSGANWLNLTLVIVRVGFENECSFYQIINFLCCASVSCLAVF